MSSISKPLLLSMALGLGLSVVAQTQPVCAPGFVHLDQAIDQASAQAATERAKQQSSENLRAGLAEMDAETPLTAPSARQVEPTEDSSGTEVGKADFPTLMGFGLDMTESADGVTKLSLTPFTFLTAVQPAYLFDPERYDSTLARRLRRVGASFSFGGKGEAFDRDGDGKVDEALESKDWGDIVTWEAKWRIYGSRDRREGKNAQRFYDSIKSKFVPVLDESARLRVAVEGQLRNQQAPQNPANTGCYPEEMLTSILAQPEINPRIQARTEAEADYRETAQSVFDEIDRRLIVSLVAGGTERGEEFGPDKQKFALQAEAGAEGTDNSYTAELSWSETEGLVGALDQEMWKFGLQYSTLVGNVLAMSDEKMTLSFSAAYEMYDNVPTVKHDTIAKANAKLKIPVGDGVSFPLSVTWANHRDIITDEREIQGHFGFTLELSKMMQKMVAQRASNAAQQ